VAGKSGQHDVSKEQYVKESVLPETEHSFPARNSIPGSGTIFRNRQNPEYHCLPVAIKTSGHQENSTASIQIPFCPPHPRERSGGVGPVSAAASCTTAGPPCFRIPGYFGIPPQLRTGHTTLSPLSHPPPPSPHNQRKSPIKANRRSTSTPEKLQWCCVFDAGS